VKSNVRQSQPLSARSGHVGRTITDMLLTSAFEVRLGDSNLIVASKATP
jgi:hypothetical protein